MSIRQNNRELLGHIISPQGVAMDLKKIDSIMGSPTTTSLEALKRFFRPHWVLLHVRPVVQGYGSIAKPLTELLKKMPLDGQPKWRNRSIN